ncbi:hypothetical protein HAX54_002241, partial [Datura stramonium]|nr:hypothetical protein [Datura stramonium]
MQPCLKSSEKVRLLRSNQVHNVVSQGSIDTLVQNELMVQHLSTDKIQIDSTVQIQGSSSSDVQHDVNEKSQTTVSDKSQLISSEQIQQVQVYFHKKRQNDQKQNQVWVADDQHAVYRGPTQGYVLEIDQVQGLKSSQEQLQKIEQLQLLKNLTGEGILVDSFVHDQSSKSKSKNNL